MMKAHTNHQTLTQQEALPKTMGFLEYQVMRMEIVFIYDEVPWCPVPNLRNYKFQTQPPRPAPSRPSLQEERKKDSSQDPPGLIFRLVALILTKHGCNQVVSW